MVWLLILVAVVAGIGLPIYRAGSQSSPASSGTSPTDPEIVDAMASAPQTTEIQIPTRLVAHTNGTVSILFQGQTNCTYRIDYADSKAATLADMVWTVATDDISYVSTGWTEWVDAGAMNRTAPDAVNERYYRVVLKTNLTAVATEQTSQQSLNAAGESQSAPSAGQSVNGGQPSTALPQEILQILSKQNALSTWSQSSSARHLQELQECQTLGELVAGGLATEDALIKALANSRLKISILMTLGESLFRSADRHHAIMFFEAIVHNHSQRATTKQAARSYLWLGKLHQDEGLDRKYQQQNAEQAKSELAAAAINYLRAKDSSQDWVRGNGWLGAAACYREIGDSESQRDCLTKLMSESRFVVQTSTNQNSSHSDANLYSVDRDLANYLLGASYYEEKRYEEAANVYRQIQDRLKDQPEEYVGQKQYLELASKGLTSCVAEQMRPTGDSQRLNAPETQASR